ncbi:MAG: hypothetical protein RB191_02175 [Terriglobia bacterium]|nr:hypothetical protein [Terriglobia bacterium]
MRQRGESQEAYLSRLGQERDAQEAAKRGLSLEGLRALQRTCPHEHVKPGHYVDTCLDCDAALEETRYRCSAARIAHEHAEEVLDIEVQAMRGTQ